jgi:hypothetical protein
MRGAMAESAVSDDHDPGGGVTGVEEPDSGMFVSSACIVNCGPERLDELTVTGVNPATADGAIRKGIESSIG